MLRRILEVMGRFIHALLLAAVPWGFVPLAGAAEVRPNILLIVVDDLRFDDFGAAGHPFARTPHLDRVAREGAQFRN
ncbi:MAG: sulfatase-like hydrolase/transferase, partial [Opitutaceae bacterium]